MLTACGDETEVDDPIEETAAADAAFTEDLYDPHAFDDMEDGSLKFYLKVQDALVHDRLDQGRTALVQMVGHAEPGALQSLASSAAAAADIEAARRAFKPLSAAMLSAEVPEGYGAVYCPMAFDYEGAYWIQKEGEVMNPYFGAGMLHCGAFKDVERVRRRLQAESE